MELFVKILNEHYKKSAINIIKMEGGWSAQAYKVNTADGIFFLKVYEKHRLSTGIWTAKIDTYMPIVLWLYNNTNLRGKISYPILTVDGQYKCNDERFIFLLFPYIEGYTLCDKLMTREQVRELAEIVAELHKYGDEIPVKADTIEEDFKIPFCDELKRLLSLPNQPSFKETIDVLKQHEMILIENIEKTQKLADKISKENLPKVLCHTDIHGWNLMQSDKLILIDWEGMRLAPSEADLFAFIGDKFWHRCSKEFMEIYKKIHPNYEINTDALTFYQTRRRLEDICAFAQGLLFEDIDDEERKKSLYLLRRECVDLLR